MGASFILGLRAIILELLPVVLHLDEGRLDKLGEFLERGVLVEMFPMPTISPPLVVGRKVFFADKSPSVASPSLTM